MGPTFFFHLLSYVVSHLMWPYERRKKMLEV